MTSPLLISTWSFSLPIIETQFPNLVTAGSALDVVEQCAIAAELDESIDSVGYGGSPDREGRCTFDAAVMTSPSESGSVCGLERHLHPVSVARLVMERTEHSMLVGSLADDFADSHGLESSSILLSVQKQSGNGGSNRTKTQHLLLHLIMDMVNSLEVTIRLELLQ